MLSIDLFNSKFEKRLREGAVDSTIEHLLKPLSLRAAEIRTQLRSGRLDPKQIDQLEKEYEDLVQKRLDIMLDRKPQTEQQQQPPAKGLLKGKDLVTPQQRVAGATPAKPGVAGAVKDVVGGVKRWLKGEPDQGPTYEQQEQPVQNPRALGVANFQRLVKANMGNIPTVSLEFIRPEENFKLDQKGLDLISDYYDGLENDQAKNYFIYRVLPSGEETAKVLKQLGWTPKRKMQNPEQPELPGMPKQGELPLEEKKKSDNPDDIKAGDIKVARELQKLRAQYPAAKSDVEAVARAEIDSTERSQQQLSAIRGANEKQDALLKQLVALDQEQGREIDGLDQENNSLEQRLAQVQATNDRLQQAIGKMTGTKKAATKTTDTNVPPTGSADLAQGGIIDVGTPGASAPKAKPEPTTSPAMAAMARQIQGLGTSSPGSMRPAPNIGRDASNDPKQQSQKVAGSDVTNEGEAQDTIRRYLAIDAENDVDAVRAAIQAVSRDPELGANSKARLLGQIGMIIRRHRLPIGRSYYTYMQRYMEEQTNPKLDALIKNIQARMKKDDYQRPEIMKRVAQMVQQADPTTQDAMTTAQQLVQQYGQGPVVKQTNVNDLKAQARSGNLTAQLPKTSAGTPSYAQQYATFEEQYTNDDDWYDEEDDRLRDGDYVRDRQDGEYGEVFKMAGDPSERRVRILDRDGKGWYISPERLVAVDRNDPDIQKYFGKRRHRDMDEGWSDRYNPTPYSVYIDGREWKAFASDDHARAVAEKVQANLELQGRKQTVTIAPSKTKKVQEAKEIHTREDFIRERDRLLRMISQETNPANKQILRSAIRQLENRAENEGWITVQTRMVREESSGEDVERAILNRIMVAHTDLLMKFGPEKVMQAAEEVAYNVGDVDEIGTSDVSAYVAQVKQILGVPEELDEKWSQKYKSSINCANPKGFSQRAHCQGRKKK